MRAGVLPNRLVEAEDGALFPELLPPELDLGVSLGVTVVGAGVCDAGGLVALVVTGVDGVVVLVRELCGRSLIVPSKFPKPICPTPPKSCISCCWDMLFSRFCKSPSRLISLLRMGVGGLFKYSFIFLQCSSSFSPLTSCK